MANNLTGDYDGVVQLRPRGVNRILAAPRRPHHLAHDTVDSGRAARTFCRAMEILKEKQRS
jgi:hypothetical protein